LPDEQKDRLEAGDATALMVENPTLLKRPVIDLGDRRLVGFDAAVTTALQALKP
jgi:arsenate reductase